MERNNYALKITPAARDDLDIIYRYISEELYNAAAADKLMEKIERNFLRLQEFPFSCNYVTDMILRNKGYRKLVINDYVGFYIADESGKSVIIIRVFHGKQKYQDLI